jgi:hypothetical protein
MGGHGCDIIVHGWASVLCNFASSSKSDSNFSDLRNTLIKKPSGLKPTTMNDLLFVQSNQDLVHAGNTHYIIFEYMGAIWIACVGMGENMSCYGWAWVGIGGHMSCYGWAWVDISRCWWLWSGYGYKFEGKCWALPHTNWRYWNWNVGLEALEFVSHPNFVMFSCVIIQSDASEQRGWCMALSYGRGYQSLPWKEHNLWAPLTNELIEPSIFPWPAVHSKLRSITPVAT